MSTATKLSYLNETKSQIKSMINYGLETPLTNEPFRDYVSSIFKAFIQSLNNPDTLWGNLPKITGTGTNITLNNTIEAPMKIELSPVELSQAGTPTPSSPQDIHTISGSNKVVVSDGNGNSQEAEVDLGTNRLRFPYQEPTITRDGITYTVNRDGSIKVKGTATATSYINLYQSTSINLLNIGTTYTYSITPSQSNMRLQFYERYNNNWNDKGYGTDKITFTVSSSSAGQMIRLIVNNGSTVDATVYPMINEGSTALPYKEYREPIEYCKIGNYEDKIFRTSGKNLVEVGTLNDYEQPNGTTPSYLTISNDTLSMVIQSGGGTRFYKKDHYTQIGNFAINSITSVASARYFLRIRKLDNSGWMTNSDATITGWNYNQYFEGWYVNTTSSSDEKSFTIPECLYWQIGFGWDTQSYQGTTQTMSYIMLNKGTTALDFEPYGSKEWYIKKNIGKVVLDGTQNVSSTAETNLFYITASNMGITYYDGGYCNYFGFISNENITANSSANNNLSNNQMAFRLGSTKDRLYIKSNEYADNTALQTWFTNNNTTIYYILDTPTYTKITGTLAEQLEAIKYSKDGQTNISQVNNDLAFGLSVQAIEDLR